MTVKGTDRPALFDPGLLAQRRDRAVRAGFAGRGDFVHREVAALLAERLTEVTRSFADVAVVGSGGGVHAEALSSVLPGARIRQLEVGPALARCAGVDPVAGLEVLDLQPESLDLVISCLEMQWQNDPVGHLIQMRRALRPDGLAVAVLFGGQTLAELRAALAEAEVETAGGLSPRVAPMGDLRELGGLLQRAGYAMPVADSQRLDVTYADVVGLMRDLRAMGETNMMAARHRGGLRRGTLARCGQIYADAFAAPGGRIRATFELAFLTGWAPAPDQPKPLRPGSASARLADALGSVEQSAGETAGKARKG